MRKSINKMRKKLNGLELYRSINSIFAEFKFREQIKSIIEEKRFNLSVEDLLIFHDNTKCSLDDFKEYVKATIKLFVSNKTKGKKLLTSLQSHLRTILIKIPLEKTGNMKNIIPQEVKTTFSKFLFSFAPVTLCHNFR